MNQGVSQVGDVVTGYTATTCACGWQYEVTDSEPRLNHKLYCEQAEKPMKPNETPEVTPCRA